MISSTVDVFLVFLFISIGLISLLLDFLCFKDHGVKIRKTIFSYAYFSEIGLVVVGVGASVLLKPVLAPLWLGASALALAILLVELWRLRV